MPGTAQANNWCMNGWITDHLKALSDSLLWECYRICPLFAWDLLLGFFFFLRVLTSIFREGRAFAQHQVEPQFTRCKTTTLNSRSAHSAYCGQSLMGKIHTGQTENNPEFDKNSLFLHSSGCRRLDAIRIRRQRTFFFFFFLVLAIPLSGMSICLWRRPIHLEGGNKYRQYI